MLGCLLSAVLILNFRCVFFLCDHAFQYSLPVYSLWIEGWDVGLTLGWKAPCSELKGPECGSSGGMPGMVGG